MSLSRQEELPKRKDEKDSPLMAQGYRHTARIPPMEKRLSKWNERSIGLNLLWCREAFRADR